MSGTGGRFYDENEAEEILRLAARDGASGRMDKDRLLSMAAELGISPEAVERAETELTAKRQAEQETQKEAQLRAEYKSHRRRELWGSLGSFITLNGLMIGIWFFAGSGYFWPFWVFFGTGFGVIPRAFGRGSERDYQRWKRRRFGPEERPKQENVRSILDELAHRDDLGKLEVIKELRERTGLGLADAKDAVEQYADENDHVVW